MPDHSLLMPNATERVLPGDGAAFDRVVSALKPGLYLVCSRCRRFGTCVIIHMALGETLCTECA